MAGREDAIHREAVQGGIHASCQRLITPIAAVAALDERPPRLSPRRRLLAVRHTTTASVAKAAPNAWAKLARPEDRSTRSGPQLKVSP